MHTGWSTKLMYRSLSDLAFLSTCIFTRSQQGGSSVSSPVTHHYRITKGGVNSVVMSYWATNGYVCENTRLPLLFHSLPTEWNHMVLRTHSRIGTLFVRWLVREQPYLFWSEFVTPYGQQAAAMDFSEVLVCKWWDTTIGSIGWTKERSLLLIRTLTNNRDLSLVQPSSFTNQNFTEIPRHHLSQVSLIRPLPFDLIAYHILIFLNVVDKQWDQREVACDKWCRVTKRYTRSKHISGISWL